MLNAAKSVLIHDYQSMLLLKIILHQKLKVFHHLCEIDLNNFYVTEKKSAVESLKQRHGSNIPIEKGLFYIIKQCFIDEMNCLHTRIKLVFNWKMKLLTCSLLIG